MAEAYYRHPGRRHASIVSRLLIEWSSTLESRLRPDIRLRIRTAVPTEVGISNSIKKLQIDPTVTAQCIVLLHSPSAQSPGFSPRFCSCSNPDRAPIGVESLDVVKRNSSGHGEQRRHAIILALGLGRACLGSALSFSDHLLEHKSLLCQCCNFVCGLSASFQ